MAETGFKSEKSSKKLNNERTAQTIIKGAIFGDALVCVGKVVRQLGLPVDEVSTTVRSMFGPMETPFIHHSTGGGVAIPYGSYSVKGLGKITPSDSDHIVPELTLTITFEKGADEALWTKFLDMLYLELAAHESMFKHKAIKVQRPLDMVVPRYIDLSAKIPLFLNKEVDRDIDTNIFFPITNAEKLVEIGAGGYRGILLHGKYGTGKSLIAYETAKRSVAKLRTFVLCNAGMVEHAVEISRFMQPSTLFIEDMDTMSMGGRGLSTLRNLLSGVESKKGSDVIIILTTNLLSEIERMDRSLLRPDRVDAIVEILPPDISTVQRIIEHHAKGWMSDEDWVGVYTRATLAGCTPAILVEVIKRSKITAMREGCQVTTAIVDEQLGKMSRQIELSEPAKPLPTNAIGQFAETLKDITFNGIVED